MRITDKKQKLACKMFLFYPYVIFRIMFSKNIASAYATGLDTSAYAESQKPQNLTREGCFSLINSTKIDTSRDYKNLSLYKAHARQNKKVKVKFDTTRTVPLAELARLNDIQGLRPK